MISRYLELSLKEHLKKYRQMLFLAGPRQVGKTTLAQSLIQNFRPGFNAFNWDVQPERKMLTTQVFPGKFPLNQPGQELLLFDEIHKYPRWKNTLKGLFDKYEPKTHWIVTGSAGLNVYRRGQDSLLGRHFTYHLFPLSLGELLDKPGIISSPKVLANASWNSPTEEGVDCWQHLIRFGGFPEPFLKQEDSFLRQWRSNRLERLIHQDLAAVENLKKLPLVENMMFLLPERAGSLLSLNSLRENLDVHFATAKHWLSLLERVFYCFTLRPYAKKMARALRKETKLYLWDWSEVEEEGARFENCVALHLLKYVYYLNDLGLAQTSLHFLRDKEKREVDFLICENGSPVLGIECKLKRQDPSQHLAYYAKALNLKRVIQLDAGFEPADICIKSGVPVTRVSAPSFFRSLV